MTGHAQCLAGLLECCTVALGIVMFTWIVWQLGKRWPG